MKKVWTKWTGISLIIRILIGLGIGIVLGLVCPQAAPIGFLGEIFVTCLKSIAPILVFALIISSLANAKGSHGKIIGNVVFLYIISTVIAALVAVIASKLFPVSIVLPNAANTVTEHVPSNITEVLRNIFLNMIRNTVASLAEGNYLGILFWSIILGIALKKSPDGIKRRRFKFARSSR